MRDFIKRRWRELLIIITILSGCLYWFSWHWKPFTQNAFVFADTRPVSPPVEGFITEIHVKNNQFVRKGDPLFTVFREPYRLNRAALENEVRAKQAEHLALQAEIRSQEAEIRRCQAELANNRYLADRAAAAELVHSEAENGDVVLVMGARDNSLSAWAAELAKQSDAGE